MASRSYTAVEGLRFLLFLGVFGFHCISLWFPIGWGGVQAFLVIGAFFLTKKLINKDSKSIAVRDGFLHRIKRLYPVYIIIIVSVVAFFAISKHQINVDSIWYLFSLQNFRCFFHSSWDSLDRFLGHFWYIGLDVWLFLLWILLMRMVPKHRLRSAFIITLCVGLSWRTLSILMFPNNMSLAYAFPLGQLDCWSIGGLLALDISKCGKSNRMLYAELIIGISGVLLLVLYNAWLNDISCIKSFVRFRNPNGYMHNPVTGNVHFFIALLSAGGLRYCLDTTRRHPVLSSLPLVALGGMSYELYCFHFPIVFITSHFIINPLLLLIIALLATYIISFCWCRYIMPVVNRIIK